MRDFLQGRWIKLQKLQYHIGCAGWSYVDWKKAGFYPKSLSSSDFLSHYGQVFNFAEINSTFYRSQSTQVFRKWIEQVPDDFQFSVKVWQNITHSHLSLNELLASIRNFFSPIFPIQSHIAMFLLQFPPSFHDSPDHYKKIHFLLHNLPTWGKYVIEFRHPSWYSSAILNEIETTSNSYLATTYLDYLEPYYAPNQNIQYIRMIGDRELTHFDHTQRPQETSMQELIEKLHQLSKIPTLEEIFVIFNNHFRGFAPQDVIDLHNALNLPVKSFQRNKSLLDFL